MVIWNTPHEFYVQLKSYEADYEEMMEAIQRSYQTRSASAAKPPIGSIVVVRHRDEDCFKRGRIVDYNQSLDKYRVELIDCGNKIICSLKAIYDVEKSLTRLPALAIRCSFPAVMRNTTADEIRTKLRNYINTGEATRCTFIRADEGITYVDVSVGDVDLKSAMIKDGLIAALPEGWPTTPMNVSIV